MLIVPISLRALLLILCVVFLPSMAQAESKSANRDKAQIEELIARWNKAFTAKDLDGVMAVYAPGQELFVFDVVPPRDYRGWEAYKKDYAELFAAFPGPLTNTISETSITIARTMAYSHNIDTGRFTRKDGSTVDLVVRVTDVYRKIRGKWLIVHEHVSVPVDLETGKADLLSKVQ